MYHLVRQTVFERRLDFVYYQEKEPTQVCVCVCVLIELTH